MLLNMITTIGGKARLSTAVILIFTFSTMCYSQFKTFSIEKPLFRGDFEALKLVQIDFSENSTLLHFTFTSPSPLENCIYISRDIKLIEIASKKTYQLINSYNIPLDNSNEFGCLMKFGEKLNFTLEFEKVREGFNYFDVVEMEGNKNAFNIYGVLIDINKTTDTYLNLDDFLNQTPLVKKKYFYNEGDIVQFLSDSSGLIIAAQIVLDKTYGKYFQVDFSIKNLTGQSIEINPEDIYVDYIDEYGELAKQTKPLSHEEYMKKVKRRQNWNSLALGFSAGLSASSAGYSSSTSYETTYDYTTYPYSTTYSTTYTANYNGAAAYEAQQNATNVLNQFQGEQYEIKNTLNEGYLKRHTLFNETEYLGFINIPFSRKIKGLNVVVPLNGKKYTFAF
ncbi:hypothetical protein [Flagellimonas zhangzhouensis]|uniref:Uncharacterized protein n=1 Tax=Flagellimonas zhangzhouensis TaxID=1073328 RepID=A0A1H2UAN7_9FLAO|nr:hypothetical protein [Allomuricauda zhangzhouensis]SDQ18662.1 hypothetical protein SAMN05216294_0777 [Allomuricauda zhangzhouensis]SDW53196.1 hypothetical protein SAMN04487892_1516 [Allomuricauda zhangzhouensis]